MEQSAVTVQTVLHNALYINPIEYSSILIIYHCKTYWIIFTIYTGKNFDNNAWNLGHKAIIVMQENYELNKR